MAFIDKNDILGVIRLADLDQITGGDDTQLNHGIAWAESVIAMYLRHKYDVATILTATGSNRDQLLLDCAINIAVYRAHYLINPRNIPEYRIAEYEMSVDRLKDIQSSKALLDIPLKNEEGKRGFKIRHGSTGTKFNQGKY
jgi:hypothetical protein